MPLSFRFRGYALFDSPLLMQSHLSFDYDNVHGFLGLLGVKKMDIYQLSSDFVSWFEEAGVAELKEKPSAWHSRVARAFLRQFPSLRSTQEASNHSP